MYFALPVANTYSISKHFGTGCQNNKKYPKSIPWESNVMHVHHPC